MHSNLNNSCAKDTTSSLIASSIDKVEEPKLLKELYKRELITIGTVTELKNRLL